MKYSDQKPPNWDKLVSLFGADWKNTVVTYGDTVHAAKNPTPDLWAHEEVHSGQQKAYPGGIEAWWDRYYTDVEFRREQETEAYRAQMAFIKLQTRDRNLIFRIQDKLARDLAGAQYGSCMTYGDAFREIEQKPKAVAA